MNPCGHAFGHASVILLALALVGCSKKEPESQASPAVARAEADAKADGDAKPDAEAESAEPSDAAATSGETPAVASDDTGEPAAADTGDDDDEAGDETAGEEPEDQAAAAEEPEGPDPKALLTTAARPRTSDAEARRLLGQAEEAGASVREVARTAVDRGLALHATPDRAKAFFEWAAEKDPAYPDPMWHLARQAAVEGDVDRAKEMLGVVKQRGGKKLLQQIDFDPMWEILKDDPDVRKLL
jgi:hypothetical protein